jgi:hypothetical protein
MQAPMLVLKNNSKRESGRKVQLSNIKAAKTISDIVSSHYLEQFNFKLLQYENVILLHWIMVMGIIYCSITVLSGGILQYFIMLKERYVCYTELFHSPKCAFQISDSNMSGTKSYVENAYGSYGRNRHDK